jgi:hypothetical protein
LNNKSNGKVELETMNQRTFLKDQMVQLARLLDEAKDDPVLAPQLQQRLEDVEEQLRAIETKEENEKGP